jgi:NarL family two-component system response regulator LiaR
VPKTILLVDDNPAIRTLARNYLESETGIVICGEASDGVEGVQRALELSPDLIVMDLAMPRMGGVEAARQLRRKLPQVPIILFTLYADAVSSSDVKEAGIWAIISKSEPQKLLPGVLNLLGDRGR